MSAGAERRALQIVVALACVVPLTAGATGIYASAGMVAGVEHPLPPDLDSHFRFLSGLLLGIGVAFALCIPAIERRGASFRLLALAVMIGGGARLLSLLSTGAPGAGHVFGLAMELGVVPLLALWQARVGRRFLPVDQAPKNS